MISIETHNWPMCRVRDFGTLSHQWDEYLPNHTQELVANTTWTSRLFAFLFAIVVLMYFYFSFSVLIFAPFLRERRKNIKLGR